MSEIKQKFIAVIGSRLCTVEEARIAEEVGQELAKKNAVLICGGMGGIMEAACRGAKSNGGITVGILPGDLKHEANPYVQIPIVTGMGYARNAMIVKSSHAVIAISGSFGTLSEIAFALQSGIPVIGIDTWSLAKNEQQDSSIVAANSAIEAVKLALELS